MYTHILFIVVAYVLGLLVPFWFFVITVFAFCLWLRSELFIVVAFAIDLQYGLLDSVIPWYILGGFLAAVAAEWMRPRLYIKTV